MRSFSRPWLREIEMNVSADAPEVTLVVGNKQATGFTARQRQQDVIRERLRNATDLQAFPSRHVRQQVAGTVPRIGGRPNRASGSFENGEDIPFERASILAPFHSGAQLLGHDDAEVLEWRERPMEALKCFVCGTIPKGVNEELRVEDVLARHASHGSTSGDTISMPSIARVPLTSLR
jgi:hypothetical protein